MVEKRVLTTGEVAKYCGVNFRTVIRWIERGQLKGYQLPGRGDRRVEVEDLLAFLEENDMPVPEELCENPRRLLVVEDDNVAALAITESLKASGWETMRARDGLEAGSLLESFQPAMMTLDLRMSGLSGLEVIRFVRERDHLSHIKILVISGMPPQELQQALDAGADDVLAKPFTQERLLDAVQQLTAAATS